MTTSLKERYGSFFEHGEKFRQDAGASEFDRLHPENLPQDLWPLIPYAEFWGIPDDGFREELVEQAPIEIFREFRATVSNHKSTLLDWLSGPEADRTPTAEYVAFSAMLMAYDYPRQ